MGGGTDTKMPLKVRWVFFKGLYGTPYVYNKKEMHNYNQINVVKHWRFYVRNLGAPLSATVEGF